jgi:hypothetical protein
MAGDREPSGQAAAIVLGLRSVTGTNARSGTAWRLATETGMNATAWPSATASRLAGRVLLKFVYLLVRPVLGLAVLMVRGDGAKEAELLVLRHENAVLLRCAGRVRYEPADRMWFAALARLLPRRLWTDIFPVTTATLLA